MRTECPGCVEALSALMDGELDAAGELDLRRHLDACSVCEALRGDLEELSVALTTTVGRTPAPRALARRLTARRPGRSLSTIGVSAAIVMLAAAIVWGLRGDGSADADMVSDHRRLIAATQSLDLPSSDAKLVARGLGERLPFRIEFASASDAHLRGGHACRIRGVDAAYLQYERHGELISVFAHLGGTPERTSGPRCRDLGGERLCSWVSDGQTVTVVGSHTAALSSPAAIRLDAL